MKPGATRSKPVDTAVSKESRVDKNEVYGTSLCEFLVSVQQQK